MASRRGWLAIIARKLVPYVRDEGILKRFISKVFSLFSCINRNLFRVNPVGGFSRFSYYVSLTPFNLSMFLVLHIFIFISKLESKVVEIIVRILEENSQLRMLVIC